MGLRSFRDYGWTPAECEETGGNAQPSRRGNTFAPYRWRPCARGVSLRLNGEAPAVTCERIYESVIFQIRLDN